MRRVVRVAATAVPPIGGAAVFCWPWGRWGLLLLFVLFTQWAVWVRLADDRPRRCVRVLGLWLFAAFTAWSGLFPEWVSPALLVVFAFLFWVVLWWPAMGGGETVPDADAESEPPSWPSVEVTGVWAWLAVFAPLAWWVALDMPVDDSGRAVAVVGACVLAVATWVFPRLLGTLGVAFAVIVAARHVPTLVGAPGPPAVVTWWLWFAGSCAWWWRARVAYLRRPVDAPDDPEPVKPVSPRVRDFTRTEVPVVGVPLRADGVREVPLARDRYADVVIGDPDEDDEDEPSLLKQVADLFPDRRRSETGKVSVRDVADRLDMTVHEVTGRLAQDGVPVARLNGVTPLAGGGSASAMNAVRWVDISAEIGDHSNPRRQGAYPEDDG